MRTVTVIDKKVVVEVDGAKVRYSLEIIRKRINNLLQDLETWREYERLLTQVAADVLSEPACCASFVAYGVHHEDCRNNPARR